MVSLSPLSPVTFLLLLLFPHSVLSIPLPFSPMSRVLFAQAKHFKSVPEEHLASLAVQAGGKDKVLVMDDPLDKDHGTVMARLQQALTHIAQSTSLSSPMLLAVCGSLFVAADAREGLFQYVPSPICCLLLVVL